MREFSTGSPVRFTLYRVERTEHPAALEKHIHTLLSSWRAENGEFFYASKREVEVAPSATVNVEPDAIGRLDIMFDVLRQGGGPKLLAPI
jgi:hypothetical protein